MNFYYNFLEEGSKESLIYYSAVDNEIIDLFYFNLSMSCLVMLMLIDHHLLYLA